MMERSGGSKGCSLSYRFSFNLLEGDGSAGALEHNRPSKVSSRNEVEVTDRSLPYFLVLIGQGIVEIVVYLQSQAQKVWKHQERRNAYQPSLNRPE